MIDERVLRLDGLWLAVKTEKHQRGWVSLEGTAASQSMMSTLDATHGVARAADALVWRTALL